MKKGGKIIIILLIVILLISFILVENIKQLIPEPTIGRIEGWEVCNNSTWTDIIFKAKVNITYPGEEFLGLLDNKIGLIIYEGGIIEGRIFYESSSHGRRRIGDISLKPFKTTGLEGEGVSLTRYYPMNTIAHKNVSEIIKIAPGEKIERDIYFRFYNSELPFIWYDQLKNEIGNVAVDLYFTFEIFNRTIEVEYSGFWESNISLDIVDKLNEFIKYLCFDEILFERTIFNANIIKHMGKKDVMLNLNFKNFFNNCTCNIWNIELIGELKRSDINDQFTILRQAFNLTKRTRFPQFYSKYFPDGLRIYANGINIMDIFFNPLDNDVNPELFKNWWKERSFNLEIKISNSLLDDWFYSHIKNNETTIFKCYSIKEGDIASQPLFKNKSSTDIAKAIPTIDLIINKSRLDDIVNLFWTIQLLILMASTALTILLITDFIYTKKFGSKRISR